MPFGHCNTSSGYLVLSIQAGTIFLIDRFLAYSHFCMTLRLSWHGIQRDAALELPAFCPLAQPINAHSKWNPWMCYIKIVVPAGVLDVKILASMLCSKLVGYGSSEQWLWSFLLCAVFVRMHLDCCWNVCAQKLHLLTNANACKNSNLLYKPSLAAPLAFSPACLIVEAMLPHCLSLHCVEL